MLPRKTLAPAADRERGTAMMNFTQVGSGRTLVAVAWTAWGILAFLTAAFLAWRLLAAVDFLYPLWYEVIDLDATIATYGPRNRYRRDFETTTRAERLRLFAAIVTAIHRDGDGLDRLVYHTPTGQPIAPLLTPPEITHLRDVARLVTLGERAGWAALLGWLAATAWLLWRRPPPPSPKTVAIIAGAVPCLLGLTLALGGPTRVFYVLHTWIFPPGHAWFFYYQDSLMTTMMKAPVLFGYIAAAWLPLTLLIWGATLLGARRLIRRPRPIRTP